MQSIYNFSCLVFTLESWFMIPSIMNRVYSLVVSRALVDVHTVECIRRKHRNVKSTGIGAPRQLAVFSEWCLLDYIAVAVFLSAETVLCVAHGLIIIKNIYQRYQNNGISDIISNYTETWWLKMHIWEWEAPSIRVLVSCKSLRTTMLSIYIW